MNGLFPKLVGNEKLKLQLKNDIINKTVSHAYIVEGDKNSGKKTFVWEMIKSLCCENPHDGKYCNICRNCNKINNNMFSDITLLDKKDKATISVESLRDMLSTISYSPNEDVDYKFYIIDEAEKMTVQAQNALLLSLEEPPEYVIFFLLCTDINLLLETIRSRALILRIEKFSPDFIKTYLKTVFPNKNDEEISLASTVSSGSIGTAIEILSGKSENIQYAICASDFVSLLCNGKRSEAVLFASQLKYTRAEFEIMLSFCESAIRDLIAYKNNSNELMFYTDKEKIKEISVKVPSSKLVLLYDAVTKTKNDIAISNSNVTLSMTYLASQTII